MIFLLLYFFLSMLIFSLFKLVLIFAMNRERYAGILKSSGTFENTQNFEIIETGELFNVHRI